jgi:PAS domain S-box-containing protein
MLTGKMGEEIAAYPWEQTAFGGRCTWPAHLRVAVNLILDADAPMAVVWGSDFRLIYNDRYAETIQDKHPAALGKPAAEIFPEVWSAVAPLFERALSGVAVSIEDHEIVLTRRGITKTAYFYLSYSPIRDDHGQVDGFLAVVIETTARVMVERERFEVCETLLSSISDFAYTFDTGGKFLYANKSLLDLWGLKLEEVVGKRFSDLNYPEDLALRLQSQIQQVVTQKAVVRDEAPYVGPDGVVAFYEYILCPVFGPDGSVTIVAGSTRDTTDRKKREIEASAASQARDDFLATLSHELRAPLNPVLLLASEAAENADLPPVARADFKAIADHVALEARLIDDLLDISRIRHDKLQLNIGRQDIHALLRWVLDSVHGDLRRKQIQLIPRFDASSAIVQGDEVRLHQVFFNLVRNAVKFTPPGGRITVSTHLRGNPPRLLAIEIEDTGIGLTTAELAKIFTPFVQGEHMRENAERFGGLGLGLAIARKIVALHLGGVSVQSAGRNQGAIFTVELPLDLSPLPSRGPDSKQAKVSTTLWSGESLRILLVEDHEPSRNAMARLLANRHFEVIQAGTGAEALVKAHAERIDLVISDIGLPDISGCDLMKVLKAAHGCGGIALSGYGSNEDVARSKAAGFTNHLTKPVSSRALDVALKHFACAQADPSVLPNPSERVSINPFAQETDPAHESSSL